MNKVFKTSMATILVTTALSGLTATPALAQSATTTAALSGGLGSSVVSAPWSVLRSTASATNPCSVSGPNLTHQYAVGTIAGFDGQISPDQPIVARNTGAPATNGVIVPAGAILMHPGPNNECAMLRYTVPAAGIYAVSAQYQGAYANAGVYNGDGATGMILKNGVSITNTVDTQRGAAGIGKEIALCPGDKIDFAVHMKGNHGFDSTLLAGNINKIGDASACGPVGGPVITVPVDPMAGPSPCCAPWSELDIPAALVPTFTSAAAPYTVQYQSASPSTAQMQAYLTYIHAMDPSITTITLTWKAIDAGAGSTPGMSGAQVGTTATVTWSTSGPSPVVSGAFYGSQPFQQGEWYRFWTALSHNGTQNSPFFGPDCINNTKAIRFNLAAKVGRGGDTVTMSTTDARGRVEQGEAVDFQPGVASRMRILWATDR